MQRLHTFMELLSGRFDNREQIERLKKEGIMDFPYAKHINTICNHKIEHLPEDFDGVFLIEESYYTINDKTNISSHLFLFTQNDDEIILTSYELPEGYDKTNFTYDTFQGCDYTALKKSAKFTPAHYVEQDGIWSGGSVSMFSPVLKFTLQERFSKDFLEVNEYMEVNGKRTFGYDEAILYKRL